ncbi:MAG: aldehyde dehydrogenase family protein [Ilumatobacteraceae bacterium]
MISHSSSWVNGTWCSGDDVFLDINPSRPPKTLGEFQSASQQSIADAIDAASTAFRQWGKLSYPLRGDYLNKVADRIEARAAAIGRDMALEEGKTIGEATQEAYGTAAQFRYAASVTLQPNGSSVGSRDPRVSLLMSRREPIGVVVCITPWNFPMAIPAWKIAHALAEGNTVVWKPAELTPITSIHLAECIMEADLPRGTVNMLLGSGSTVGRRLLEHPGIAAVTFTGSNAVGRALASSLVPKGIPVQLELGGSNPAIVLEDANLELAADEVAKGAFLSAGQKCTSTARVLVQTSIHEQFVNLLLEKATSWKVGDALEEDVVIGPVASLQQFEHVKSCLNSVPAKNIISGNFEPNPNENGFFVHPHIITRLTHDHEVTKHEIFGPVVSVIDAHSYPELVSMANDTPFGLSASIFTTNIDLAMRFASESESGVVKINKSTTGNEPHVPFGGHKDSGSGSAEMGWASREFLTRWKTLYFGN